MCALHRVPESIPGLVAQWHFDDETDPADGLLAVSAQDYNLALADIGNIYNLPCGASDRPVHSVLSAPISHTSNPYVVLSYIPLSNISIPLTFDFTLVSLPPCGHLRVANGTVLQAGGTSAANTTVVFYCDNPMFSSGEIVYDGVDNGVTARV